MRMVALAAFIAGSVGFMAVYIWAFPKTLFWGPSNKDPTISGAILGPLCWEPPL